MYLLKSYLLSIATLKSAQMSYPAGMRLFLKQECVPVGCVPPPAVAVLGGVCLSACWNTPPPQVWTWRLPGCGPGDPPGVGLETPRVLAWRPPKVWAWRSPQMWAWRTPLPTGVGLETPHFWRPARHAGIPPASHAGIPPPPCGQTDTCKNITFTNFVCGR